jgi:RNA polymerase sigma-70 factor (ECF subfamily)
MVDEEVFGEWVFKNYPSLLRVARRLVGDSHRAEDLVQETFKSAWSSRRLFNQDREDGVWLRTILRRRAADYWRRIKDLEKTTAEFHEVSISDVDPFRGELSEVVESALDALPKGMKEVFFLVAVEELTHREAAVRLGVPIGTVLSRFSRAREKMREQLLNFN